MSSANKPQGLSLIERLRRERNAARTQRDTLLTEVLAVVLAADRDHNSDADSMYVEVSRDAIESARRVIDRIQAKVQEDAK